MNTTSDIFDVSPDLYTLPRGALQLEQHQAPSPLTPTY